MAVGIVCWAEVLHALKRTDPLGNPCRVVQIPGTLKLVAILSRWVVRYRYADARGRARDGFLAPFGLVLYRNGLYAIAGRLEEATSDARAAKLGMFAIERFSSAEYLRAHTFQMPADLNMHGFLHGAFGPHL